MYFLNSMIFNLQLLRFNQTVFSTKCASFDKRVEVMSNQNSFFFFQGHKIPEKLHFIGYCSWLYAVVYRFWILILFDFVCERCRNIVTITTYLLFYHFSKLFIFRRYLGRQWSNTYQLCSIQFEGSFPSLSFDLLYQFFLRLRSYHFVLTKMNHHSSQHLAIHF